MDIRGASIAPSFSARFERAQQFFRERRAAPWRPLLYTLGFINISGFFAAGVGLYAVTRLLSIGRHDPRGFMKPIDALMAFNGAFPLSAAISTWIVSHDVGLEYLKKGCRFFGEMLHVNPRVRPELDNLVNKVANLETLVVVGGLFISVGLARYIYTVATSGREIRALANAALGEDALVVASQFLTAEKRIDRRIVYQTMEEIKTRDQTRFTDILRSMQNAQASSRRTQKLLDKLQKLAEG